MDGIEEEEEMHYQHSKEAKVHLLGFALGFTHFGMECHTQNMFGLLLKKRKSILLLSGHWPAKNEY